MGYRVKIQKIDGDKKSIVVDDYCDTFIALINDEKGKGFKEVGANISVSMAAKMILSSKFLSEAHKAAIAYTVAEHMGSMFPNDPEDELADKIGGDLQ